MSPVARPGSHVSDVNVHFATEIHCTRTNGVRGINIVRQKICGTGRTRYVTRPRRSYREPVCAGQPEPLHAPAGPCDRRVPAWWLPIRRLIARAREAERARVHARGRILATLAAIPLRDSTLVSAILVAVLVHVFPKLTGSYFIFFRVCYFLVVSQPFASVRPSRPQDRLRVLSVRLWLHRRRSKLRVCGLRQRSTSSSPAVYIDGPCFVCRLVT